MIMWCELHQVDHEGCAWLEAFPPVSEDVQQETDNQEKEDRQ
jgi:hypothetical protein